MSTRRSGSGRTSVLWLLQLSILLTLAWPLAGAPPAMEAEVGFAGHVVAGRYAPLRIRLWNAPAGGSIEVRQSLGTPWRGTGTVVHVLDRPVPREGTLESAVPIYDVLHPVTVTLLDAGGDPIASAVVDLGLTQHQLGFPLVYGSVPHLPRSLSAVSTAVLPTDWWAYDPTAWLWIATPPPPDRWPAVARWVTSGGTLVLSTGTDFFRLDTAAVRELLPMVEPVLTSTAAGERLLGGALKPGATTRLRRGDRPLLVVGGYGAGRVVLVTVSSAALTKEEVTSIIGSIPARRRLALVGQAETALGGLSLARPGYPAAVWVWGASVVGLGLSAAVGRRRARLGIAMTIALVGGLTVWSGLYAKPSQALTPIYGYKTSFTLHTRFGMQVEAFAFVPVETEATFRWTWAGEAIPRQAETGGVADPLLADLPPARSAPAFYDHRYERQLSVGRTPRGVPKAFTGYGVPNGTLEVSYDRRADTLTLTHRLDPPLDEGWFFIDGYGHRLAPVPTGTSRSVPGDVERWDHLIEAAEGDELQWLSAWLPLGEGVWFVGRSARTDAAGAEAAKVRHIELHAARGTVHE